MIKQYAVISIDAWSDGDCGWDWNQYFNCGKAENVETAEAAWHYFKTEHIAEGFEEYFYIEDDGYNYVLCDKREDVYGRPLWAIVYGDVDYDEISDAN